jgi:poly-gamma-glutamate capsule biosynthesis protein CapA/YwtB (metallophosphatase superfamily)
MPFRRQPDGEKLLRLQTGKPVVVKIRFTPIEGRDATQSRCRPAWLGGGGRRGWLRIGAQPRVMRALTGGGLIALIGALTWGCDAAPENVGKTTIGTAGTATSSVAPAPTPIAGASAIVSGSPKTAPRRTLTLIAGGDLFFGRVPGQRLLADPTIDPFEHVHEWLDGGDLRFGNLECQLSDQGGQTVHPDNPLVFTGPPSGADVLKRAGFEILSMANNHMWDYGKDALVETFDHLERVGIAYVGAGRSREQAYGPVILEREGFKVAFLAVTDIWNQGPMHLHPARELVARADIDLVTQAVAPLASDPAIDAIVVSYHGGSEYLEGPVETTRGIVHAAIDAGADIVIGHHPHVVQGVGWYRDKPILYSLGNFTMPMNDAHPWSRYGYLARITLGAQATPQVEACPYRLQGFRPIPLWREGTKPMAEHFFRRFGWISKHVAGSTIGAIGAEGCAPVGPPSEPVAGAIP